MYSLGTLPASLWALFSSPSKTCVIHMSDSIPIPNGTSDSDREARIENGLKQLSQRVQKRKDTIYAILLVTMGGLGTLSFLLLGD
jgi:hypothetical protein